MSDAEQLKISYKNSLDEKANILHALFKEWREEKNEHTQLQLCSYLHKLAGSLGMYDYDELSELAREVMKNLNLKQPEEIEPELSELVTSLRQQ